MRSAVHAAVRELAPDTKALRDASSLTDPDKQIEALRTVIADCPTSPASGNAEKLIITTLVRKTSADIRSLQDQAKTFVGGAAALKLAAYAKRANHSYEQLEYLTAATLAGRVTAESRAALEAVYKQTLGGSIADLDRMLDERYEKEAPKVDAALDRYSQTDLALLVYHLHIPGPDPMTNPSTQTRNLHGVRLHASPARLELQGV